MTDPKTETEEIAYVQLINYNQTDQGDFVRIVETWVPAKAGEYAPLICDGLAMKLLDRKLVR